MMYAQDMLNGQIKDAEKEPADKFVRIARMKNFLYICKSFEKHIANVFPYRTI